jgi:hypothetical protein
MDDQTSIYIATEAAQVSVDGTEMALVPGVTTVRAGHPVLAKYPDWFKPFTPTYDWAAPRSQVRPDQRAARTR